MIDIHSHILPGVDDGAKTLAKALDMLKIAIDQGITSQVLTPHIDFSRFSNTRNSIIQQFDVFKKQVKCAGLDIELLLAAELRISQDLIMLAKADAIPCLGEMDGKRTFLLEFPRFDIPLGSDQLVRWLLAKDYLPIVVHPERNRTFLHNPNKLQAFIDLGCPLQVTASSFTGNFGVEVRRMAEELLAAGSVSVIASDCHNLKSRSPDLLAGYECCKIIAGHQGALNLVYDNPSKIINKNKYRYES